MDTVDVTVRFDLLLPRAPKWVLYTSENGELVERTIGGQPITPEQHRRNLADGDSAEMLEEFARR